MPTFFRAIARGYAGIFRGLALLAVLLGASAVCGLLVGWPLWIFATARSGTYSLCALAVIGAGIVALIVRGMTRKRRATTRSRNPLVTALLILASIAVLVGGLYAVLLLASRMLVVPAVLALVGVVLLLGYLSHALQTIPRRSPSVYHPSSSADNQNEWPEKTDSSS